MQRWRRLNRSNYRPSPTRPFTLKRAAHSFRRCQRIIRCVLRVLLKFCLALHLFLHLLSFVAIKKIRLRSAAEGLSMEAIRELKLMCELSHPNVLRLLDCFSHHSNIHLVLEYMSGDLEGLLRGRAARQQPLAPADIKAYMKMLLQGIEHCHQNWYW